MHVYTVYLIYFALLHLHMRKKTGNRNDKVYSLLERKTRDKNMEHGSRKLKRRQISCYMRWKPSTPVISLGMYVLNQIWLLQLYDKSQLSDFDGHVNGLIMSLVLWGISNNVWLQQRRMEFNLRCSQQHCFQFNMTAFYKGNVWGLSRLYSLHGAMWLC